ncbi:MAG: TetR family transcriptional regulator [Gammaproteobacteria bacterium]|nr:TetR family transcriptional regulator [Gammaproteobacteria bacterium]MBU1724111.1 TetR family transcriptional regulator [Gammaproteobacteria bacterium]MBU2006813.1 TetR family transcriptional regulator [Gammaproteobacteria bacterium]
MKINAQDQQLTRVRILEAAVDVITIKGFKSATMREIAKQAQVGDATIYNYFPTKEKLLYGYCEYVQQQVMLELKEISDFHEYSVQEQLQQLVETNLRVWLPAREFLQQVFEISFAEPVAGFTNIAETKRLFTAMVVDMLDAAVEAGEIPDQPYRELLPRLFWDYMTGIMAYWLKDTSEGFANTTQVIDRSMELVANILQQGMVGKLLDLASFLFRTHIMSHMDSLKNLYQAPDLAAAKRRFMEGK